MYVKTNKPEHRFAKQVNTGKAAVQLQDNRPKTVLQQKAATAANKCIQRVAYFTGKRGQKQDDQKNLIGEAITEQTKRIKGIDKLYITPEETSQDWGDKTEMKAYEDKKEKSTEVNRVKPLEPKGGAVREYWPVSFKSGYASYKIDLISHPDVKLPKKDTNVTDFINERIQPPFGIEKITLPGNSKGSMGRTYTNRIKWGLNPDMEKGQSSKPDIEKFGLKNEDKYDDKMKDYEKLPSDESQQFMFFVNKEDYDKGTAKHKANFHQHINRRFKTKEDFGKLFNMDNDKHQKQASTAPLKDRKEGDRIPEKTMGGSASKRAFDSEAYKPSLASGIWYTHEWCHLIGDGDSGPDIPANLVVGTHQVNTEQLAMEKALRQYRRIFLVLNRYIWIDTKVILKKINPDQISERKNKLESEIENIDQKLKVKNNRRQKTILMLQKKERVNELEIMNYKDYANHQADFIQYTISLSNSDKNVESGKDVILTQVMDAERGVITDHEYTVLFNKVKQELNKKASELKAAPVTNQSKSSPDPGNETTRQGQQITEAIEMKAKRKRKIDEMETKKAEAEYHIKVELKGKQTNESEPPKKVIKIGKVLQKKQVVLLKKDLTKYQEEGYQAEGELTDEEWEKIIALENEIESIEESIEDLDDEINELKEFFNDKLSPKDKQEIEKKEKEVTAIDDSIQKTRNFEWEIEDEIPIPQPQKLPATQKELLTRDPEPPAKETPLKKKTNEGEKSRTTLGNITNTK